MNQQKLARLLSYFPILIIAMIVDRFYIRAWEVQSFGMMFFYLAFGSYLALLYWKWVISQHEQAARDFLKTEIEKLHITVQQTMKQLLSDEEVLKTLLEKAEKKQAEGEG